MDIISYLIGISVGFMLSKNFKQISPIKLSKENYISISIVLVGVLLLVVGILTEWQIKYF